MINVQNDLARTFGNTVNANTFVTGLTVGVLVAYVATRPGVQQAVFRAAVQAVKMAKAGAAEIQERYRDAEAEIDMQRGDGT